MAECVIDGGELLSGSDDTESEYENMLQWLIVQEQWIADDKANEDIADWASMSGLYHDVQGISESLMHHQEKWFEILNQFSSSDERLGILPRWNTLVPSLVHCYEAVVRKMSAYEDKAIKMSETLISDAKNVLANTGTDTGQHVIHSIHEMMDSLNREIQFLANICQLMKPARLLSAPFELSSGNEIILVAERDDEDDDDEDEIDDRAYSGINSAINKAEILMYECRDLVEKFEALVNQASRNNDKVMQELEEVEAWLVHVQQWLWTEPQRLFDCHGSLTRESSMFTEDEMEHPELMVENTPSPYLEEYSSEPTSPVNGFNGESPALPPPNLEYEDDEEDQVFVERPTDITLKDNDSLEEEIFTPDTPQDKEFITVVPSPAKYGPPPPVLDLDSSNNHEKSELSDNEIESEAVDIGIDIREQLESQSDSYLSSEESCSTRTEDSSLEWISHIGLFEYRHNTAEEDILNVEERIPYSELILKLQSIQSSIDEQSVKKDNVLSNSAQLTSSARSPDQAREMQLRLDNVQSLWETLKSRINCRLAEMKFEYAQTEILQWLLESKSELDALPKFLVLPEEMEKILIDYKSYFKDNVQLSLKHQLISTVRNTMEELSSCRSEDEEKLAEVVVTLEEASDLICERINQRQQEMEAGLKLWKEFESVSCPLIEWIEKVELDVKEHEVYGNSLEEAEQFMKNIVSYRQCLREKYELLTKLVSYGNNIVNMVAENSPAYCHIDTVVRGTTSRWQELVVLLSNTEEELSHVLITWQEYVELYAASCDFIHHVHNIAGTKEPLETSQGNTQLLPRFIQLQKEFKDFQPKLDRLHLVKKKLKDNGRVGGDETVEKEMSLLESDWKIADDVTKGSLHHLWAEHDEWLREKIEILSVLVAKGDEIVNVEIQFIDSYSLNELINCNAKTMLHDLKEMSAEHEDVLFDLEEKVYQVQNEIEQRQKKLNESNASKDQFYKSLVTMLAEVLSKWDAILLSYNSVKSAFQLMSAQLELVVGLQDMKTAVLEMSQFSGYLSEIKEKMEYSKIAFSEAKFETLRQLSYDLDTIYRECYIGLDKELAQTNLKLPTNQEMLFSNQQLNTEIASLAKITKNVTARFILLIDWWNEYESQSKTYWSWSTVMEEHINDLQARTDEASPEDTPHDLYHIAQDLMEGITKNESLYKSVTTTVQNLIHDFNDKKVSSDELSAQLIQLQQNWDTLNTNLNALHNQLKEESDQLDEYLMKLSSFSEKLNAAYSELYDEYCTSIAPNASSETIAKQKQKIAKFTALIENMAEELKELQQSGTKWGFRVIPDEWVEEFREMSPALSDDNSDSGHYSVGKQLFTSENRLSAMKRMLQERSLDLELCEGKAAALLTSANELLEWVEEQLGLDLLLKAPPGEFAKLLQNKEGLKSLKEEFESRKHLLERLHQLAATSKGSLSEVNLKKIETLMAHLDAAWNKMEEAVSVTTQNTQNVLAMIQEFECKCTEYEQWLNDANKVLEDCGPIGADIDRLQVQEVILENLKSDILDHKKAPEDLTLEVKQISKAVEDGTVNTLLQRVETITNEYLMLEERAVENSEVCEDAKKEMQDFAKKEEVFNESLKKVKTEFENLLEKPKKPIGNIQETLDELIDFCTDVENQSTSFDEMYQLGLRISRLYIPCEAFKLHLTDLYNEWTGFVNSLNERWLWLLGLQKYWQKFEGKVKEFLNWVTEEAKRFSKEVTSTDGEKGVVDHITSCKGLHNTLNEKAEVLVEISGLADLLKPDDGEKANGTKDVDSRLNDINTHWTSICQLLEETLEQLSSVYKKLCDIQEITDAELDWLEQIILATDNKTSTQGVMEVLHEEIDKHKVYIDEIDDHRPAIEVIKVTEEFLLEHTRKSEHDDIQQRVKYILERFETLEGSERIYVEKLEKSIPLWEEFNKHRLYLSEWVQDAEGTYNSEKLRPGNAFVTECNLKNAEALFADIDEHKPTVHLLNNLMKQLSQLCLPDDHTFISEHTNQITAHVETLSDSTKARCNLLDNRLQSWQAFPNQEAKNVQEFLDNVAKEIGVEDEEEEEELSGEELLEKLKQLEALQDQQALKEAHLETIDKSTQDENIKKALESNPDISKERSNLLQGWSSASAQLSDKVVTVRLKAEMTIKMEKAMKRCTLALDIYSTHISITLPPSPLLIKIHKQWIQDQFEMCKECDESMEVLSQCFESYKDDPRVQIPKKFTDKATEMRNKHTALKQNGTMMTNQIVDRMNGWEKYCPVLKRFSAWVSTSKAELSSLHMFPAFLLEFLSLTGRFKMLENTVQEKTVEYQFLNANLEHHLFQRAPAANGKGIEEEENNQEEEEEEDYKNEEIIEYRDTFFVAQKQWESLTAGIVSFPEEVKPWQDIVNLQANIEECCNKLNERLEEARTELTQLHKNGDNPAVIVERSKQMVQEHSGRTPLLEELEQSVRDLISAEDCENHEQAREFVDQCRQLRNDWMRLEDSVKHLYDESRLKAEAWEEKALMAMAQLPLKIEEIRHKDQTILDMEGLLRQLHNQPPPPPRTPSPLPLPPATSCKRNCMKFFFFQVVILICLLIVLFLYIDPNTRCDIIETIENLSGIQILYYDSTTVRTMLMV